jgi:hypothetical protein
MNYFPDGQNFKGDDRKGGDMLLTAQRLRSILAQTGMLVTDAVVVPGAADTARALNLRSRANLNSPRVGSYDEAVEHATGLAVVMKRGLVLATPSSRIEPLIEEVTLPDLAQTPNRHQDIETRRDDIDSIITNASAQELADYQIRITEAIAAMTQD